MNLHIINAVTILPDVRTLSLTVVKDDIYINNGIIGSRQNDTQYSKIDFQNCLIMPGLVNSHHHIYSYFAKTLSFSGEFNSFENILKNLWWKLDKSLTKDAVKFSAVNTVKESIANGVTTVFDHHSSPSFVKGSLNLIGKTLNHYSLNGVLCHEISDRNGEDIMIETLQENLSFNEGTGFKNIRGMIGLHALFTLSEKTLQHISQKTENLPVHLHIAEGKIDGKQSRMKYGKSLVQRLKDFGLIRRNSIYVHGNYLKPEDIELLGSVDNVFYSQCVDSNMNNQQEIMPLLFADAGGLICTAGTDGMTSDILKSIKNSILLNKYVLAVSDILKDIPGESFHGDIYEKLFLNQFRLKQAYGFDLGLSIGDTADFIVIEYPFTDLLTRDSFMNHFIFGVTEAKVKHVFKNNRFLMKDYKLKIDDEENLDPESIVEDLNERLNNI